MKQFIVAAALSLLASALNFHDKNPKEQPQENQQRLCPTLNTPLRNCTTDGGYTVTFATPIFANDACTRLGLNLADIQEDNGEAAVRALRRCLVPWAIINNSDSTSSDIETDDTEDSGTAGSSGSSGRGVTVLTNDGVIVVNAERDYCGRNVRVAILCQSPITSSSMTSSSTMTSSSMTMTSSLTSSTTTMNLCQPTCGSGNFTLGIKGTFKNATCPFGYDLAMVNITNIQEASNILANCTSNNNSSNTNADDAIGPRAAWVLGWNRDDYGNQTCLVLTLGSAASGVGTIVPAMNCTAQYPPLCILKSNSTTNNNSTKNNSCDSGKWKLVKQKVGYEAAEGACACFPGYELAMVDQPSARIAQLYDQCLPQTGDEGMDDDMDYNDEEDKLLWIKTGGKGKCAAMLMIPGISDRFYPSYGITERACRVKAYPLCKRAQPSMPTPCPINRSSSISESETMASCPSSSTIMSSSTSGSESCSTLTNTMESEASGKIGTMSTEMSSSSSCETSAPMNPTSSMYPTSSSMEYYSEDSDYEE